MYVNYKDIIYILDYYQLKYITYGASSASSLSFNNKGIILCAPLGTHGAVNLVINTGIPLYKRLSTY